MSLCNTSPPELKALCMVSYQVMLRDTTHQCQGGMFLLVDNDSCHIRRVCVSMCVYSCRYTMGVTALTNDATIALPITYTV